MNIILTSNEPWGEIWFSKQHYAFELSKQGHHVYFINPVQNWSFKNLFSFKVNQVDVFDNLTVIDYKSNFPQRHLPFLFTFLNDFLNSFKLRFILKISNKDTVWWKFDPFRFLSIFFYKKCAKIFHVVDPYIHLWQNKHQAKSANLIICTSPKYIDYYSALTPSKVIEIPHGISPDEFNIDETKKESIIKLYQRFAIVVGTISQEIEIDLLYKLAKKNISLVIIGQELIKNNKWEEIKNFPNVFYLGKMHAKKLKNYISAASVCLILYKFEGKKEQISRSPLKALNYLAQMKPVVSSIDSDVPSLLNKGIYQASNIEDFINITLKAIESDMVIDNLSITQYLDAHLYPKLISKILKEVKTLKIF